MNKKSKYRLVFSFLSIFIGIFLFVIHTSFSISDNKVHLITLDDDTINPVTAEYIIQSIDRAEIENAECLVIKLDTPGGLLSSTRLIVKRMLTAKVPIIVYIAPGGSRAGSAGVFITYASHVAAMAPSTNIGAAHPVKMGGGGLPKKMGDWKELKELTKTLKEHIKQIKREEQKGVEKEDKKNIENEDGLNNDENPMVSKILQDTTAFIRAIAKERHRNAEWAVKSVSKSLSITDKEALEKGVIEIIAKSEEDLLNQLDGYTVIIEGKERILATNNITIERIEMNARQKFFNILANPNIAYFLMILGFYGLLFEVTHPGFGVPGIMGTIFLILAFYSMQTLPMNYAGLALLILGLILLIAEAYIPGFGFFSLGGLVSLVLGSMLLFDSIDPVMRVSMPIIITFSITTAIMTLLLLRLVIKSSKAKIMGGKEGLLQEIGEAHVSFGFGKKGTIFVHGELWNATSDLPIKKGEEVQIQEVKGLMLKVKPKIEEVK
ncbi:Putative membrane-bound ClpP-class protease associated with aq_911 [hydrothermal vent metagenome]|uniref:Membrane-bound ClpP-class protease associated with aq_911 n=1 Tax=hydrothermal vent metagenome TaxID=652676 RepID=A0A3B1DQ93_9ZZZZ